VQRIKPSLLLKSIIFGGLVLLGPLFAPGLCQAADPLTVPRVFFSPKGGCTKAITDAIGQAKQSILVQAYSFTSYPIAQALIDAEKRGVNVEAILDKGQLHETKTKLGLLAKGGVITYLDKVHAIAHNKVMIIDGKTVITGSFNFTNAAEEHNAENLLILDDSELAAEYTSNWQMHQKHSERYQI
jgi:phosphatidylserine/phosphatidylglycerophosphate/cardiolipin synthase-like enzyme